MNRQEAKRYAHKLAGDAIMSIQVPKGPDRDNIVRALGHMAETHRRNGPRTGDRAPRATVYTGEKLTFDPDDAGSDADAALLVEAKGGYVAKDNG